MAFNNGVGGILDDLIITGPDDKEHLRNLENTRLAFGQHGCEIAELLMGRRICTRLDILHPDLSARMSEKTKLGNHTTRRNFLPGDPVMVRDYRDRKRPWIEGVI